MQQCIIIRKFWESKSFFSSSFRLSRHSSLLKCAICEGHLTETANWDLAEKQGRGRKENFPCFLSLPPSRFPGQFPHLYRKERSFSPTTTMRLLFFHRVRERCRKQRGCESVCPCSHDIFPQKLTVFLSTIRGSVTG